MLGVLFLEISMYLHLDGLRFRKFSVDHSSTTLMSSCTCLKSLQEDIGLYNTYVVSIDN